MAVFGTGTPFFWLRACKLICIHVGCLCDHPCRRKSNIKIERIIRTQPYTEYVIAGLQYTAVREDIHTLRMHNMSFHVRGLAETRYPYLPAPSIPGSRFPSFPSNESRPTSSCLLFPTTSSKCALARKRERERERERERGRKEA